MQLVSIDTKVRLHCISFVVLYVLRVFVIIEHYVFTNLLVLLNLL